MDISDDKYSDERDHIDKSYEERVTNDIEYLNREVLVRRKIQTMLRDNHMKEIRWILLMMNNMTKDIRQEKEKKVIQNQNNQKLMKEIRQKIQNHLK